MEDKKSPAHRIETMQQRLNAREDSIPRKARSWLDPVPQRVSTTWGTASDGALLKKTRQPLLQTKLFRRLFFCALAFFVLSLGYAGFRLFGGATVTKENIAVEVLGNAFVDGGAPLVLQVRITNNNQSAIEFADIELLYPKSSSQAEPPARERKGIGTIRPGESKVVPFEAVFFGEQGDVRTLTATLEYRVSQSNTIFFKEALFPVTIASSPIAVEVIAPESVTPNQEFEIKILVTANTITATEPLLVAAEYPSGFSFVSSQPESAFRGTTWDIGSLASGTTREVILRGVMRIADEKERVITFRVGELHNEEDARVAVEYVSVGHTIATQSPFLTATINTGESIIASSRGAVNVVTVNWKNTTQQTISSAEIVASISGNMANKASVVVNGGLWNAELRQVSWTSTQQPVLHSIAPGESGSFAFTVQIPSTGVEINPAVGVAVGVSGILATGGERTHVDHITNATLVFGTDLAFSGEVVYLGGVFANTGPIPPVVGQETTYTIVFKVANSINSIQNAVLVGTLPNYVSWQDQVDPGTESVRYNSVTREVIWDIGTISPQKAGDKKEISIQVGITPLANQLNTMPVVMSGIEFRGQDAFTKTAIKKNIQALTTRLLKEQNPTQNSGIVISP